jgi:hypothetical protein
VVTPVAPAPVTAPTAGTGTGAGAGAGSGSGDEDDDEEKKGPGNKGDKGEGRKRKRRSAVPTGAPVPAAGGVDTTPATPATPAAPAAPATPATPAAPEQPSPAAPAAPAAPVTPITPVDTPAKTDTPNQPSTPTDNDSTYATRDDSPPKKTTDDAMNAMLDGTENEESEISKTAPFAIGVVLTLVLMAVVYWRRASAVPAAEGGTPYKPLPTAEVEMGGAGGEEQWEEDWEDLPGKTKNTPSAFKKSGSSGSLSGAGAAAGAGAGAAGSSSSGGGGGGAKAASKGALGLPMKKKQEYGSTDSNDEAGRVAPVSATTSSSGGLGVGGLSGGLGLGGGGLSGLGGLSTAYGDTTAFGAKSAPTSSSARAPPAKLAPPPAASSGDDLFASIGIAANPKFDAPKAPQRSIGAVVADTGGGWGDDDLLDDLDD